jgi:hypothetical protein
MPPKNMYILTQVNCITASLLPPQGVDGKTELLGAEGLEHTSASVTLIPMAGRVTGTSWSSSVAKGSRNPKRLCFLKACDPPPRYGANTFFALCAVCPVPLLPLNKLHTIPALLLAGWWEVQSCGSGGILYSPGRFSNPSDDKQIQKEHKNHQLP